ncbi:MAG: ADOP family duplicated permease [Terriglobales bacterium]
MRSWWRRERELQEELQSHLRLAGEDGVGGTQAARQFGNYDLVAETTRDQQPWRWLANLRRDLSLALRDLRHHPGYAAVAIATFGLAMAAFAAIYGMADAICLHPLPYVPQAERLAEIDAVGPGRGSKLVSPAEFQSLQASVSRGGAPFAAAAALATENRIWTDGAPMQVSAVEVSPGFFSSVLEVRPQEGRSFTAADFQPGSSRAMIVSYGFWQARLGGAAGALGRVLHLNGQPYMVTGILSRQFDFLGNVDVWLPLRYTPLEWSTTWRQLQSPGARRTGAAELSALGRLRPQVSWARANAALASLSPRLPEGGAAAPRLHALSEDEFVNGNLTPRFMNALLGAMGFLLLLACANVANLNLAHASARQHEMALRSALGASGLRLVQMVLTESLVLSFLGGAAGVLLASPMLHLLGRGAPKGFSAEVTGYSRIGINYHVLLMAFAICAAAGIVSGLAPGWHLFRRPAGLVALRLSSSRSRGEGGRLRQVLVAAQTALALTLLACTGLMLTSFSHFAAGTRRFQPGGAVTFAVNLPAARYATPTQRDRFYDDLLGRLRNLPEIQSAVAFTTTPYSNDGGVWVHYTAASAPAHGYPAVEQNVSLGFFSSLHVGLLRGRSFTAGDRASAPLVAVVSQALARARWPSRSAVGERVRLGSGGPWLTVVGVAADAEYEWEDRGALPAVYRPLAQSAPTQSLIAVRSLTATATVATDARRQATALDPELPLLAMRTLQDDITFGLAPIYLLGYLMSALGIIALVLALAGLYGVTAYNAQRRLRELGVRAVCGARPRQLRRLMVSETLRAVAAGMALGGFGAVLFEHAAAGFFFGVQPGEPWAVAGAAAFLLIAALAASYLPAHRAAARDPMRVLRED